ncbi:MAG: Asp-tRNA(Asn)/Glu-tRNA(Gln) amidotransferase GatCAB subunit B, partial [Firmicutes bacterium]|nr:Asp-tRNA(Asn)/Glu-tRNA(Gln) amidotransferase GatCAB subunit B [Bacillota bacterium]
SPRQLAKLLGLVQAGRLSGRMAKDVLEVMHQTGADPETIVADRGLAVVADAAALEPMVEQVVRDHPDVVADYHAGKERALGFLVGQVMKATRGQAQPAVLNELLRRRLADREGSL